MSYRGKPLYLAPLDEEKTDDNFLILTDRETVMNLAKNICNALRHPVTVIDINRIGEESDKRLRIDSDIEYISLRGSCRLLRHCAGPEKCYKCDEFHAAFLRISGDEIQNNIDLAIDNAPAFFYREYTNKPPKVLSGFNRPVIEYFCPLLGYRELLFPIYYSGMVIAILFVGQSLVLEAGDRETIKEISDSFFSNSENTPDKMFSDFLKEQNETSGTKPHSANEIKNLILEADTLTEPLDRYLSYQRQNEDEPSRHANMTFKTIYEYERFIHDACNELLKMESCLIKEAQNKRESYLEKIISTAVKGFYIAFSEHGDHVDKYTQRHDDLGRAWDSFLSVANAIQKQLNLEEILLFGDGVWLKVTEEKTKWLYPRPDESNPRFKWYYDFSAVEDKHPKTFDYICSLETDDVLNGLHPDIDIENVIMIVYSDIAVLIRVNDLKTNESLYAEMVYVIGKNFSRIRSSVALCAANFIKEHHVLTLRMNKHESAHISTRLNDNMQRYFLKDGRTFMGLNSDKQKFVVEDMHSTIRLISHMASNIGLITGSINADTIVGKAKKFDVFDLLYKWQIMFRDQLKDRNLDIVILRETDEHMPYFVRNKFVDAPRYIISNSHLFELLIYNLVDNAVKYAHRGSVIYLAWKYPENDLEQYELTVSSYGPKMKDGDSLYELYARGDTTHLHAVEGDGIGLYVVKRTGKLIGVEVSHKCDTVDNSYNIPLIKWYNKELFDNNEYTRIKPELQKCIYRNRLKLKDIVNTNKYTKIIRRRNLSQEYLIKRINRGTWLTTFKVCVPFCMKHGSTFEIEEGSRL